MKVEFSTDAATELLFALRSMIDRGSGGEIQIQDAKGLVLFRLRLPKPCAADPREGTIAFFQPTNAEDVEVENDGVAARAFLVGGGDRKIVALDVGGAGSGAAVELQKLSGGDQLTFSETDAVRARTRLVFTW